MILEGVISRVMQLVAEKPTDELPMKTVQEKLRNLGDYMHSCDWAIGGFAFYLAERLPSKCTPSKFCDTAEIALEDLQRGINGRTGKLIHSQLVGYNERVYELLKVFIPEIAEAVCPVDFAIEVGNRYNKSSIRE